MHSTEAHERLRRAKDTGYLTFCSECRKMTFWGKGIWLVLKCWMASETTQHSKNIYSLFNIITKING